MYNLAAEIAEISKIDGGTNQNFYTLRSVI